MSGIIEYLKWRGDVPFSVTPLNSSDLTVLCEMAYFPFEGIVPDDFKQKISLPEACGKCIPRLTESDPFEDLEFAEQLAESPRFGDLMLSGFVNVVDEEKQFAAYTADAGHGRKYIIFRGTDDSLIGWKEDLDLSYSEGVPSQKCAVLYIEEAVKALKGTFTIAGHSKGGNIAVYGAAFCSNKARSHIEHVYSFDGPGFNDILLEREQLKAIVPITTTFMPQGSIIGALLQHKEPVTVVHSLGKDGFEQHKLQNWQVTPTGVEILEGFSKGGEFADDSLDKWVGKITYEQKKEFVEVFYNMIRDRETIDNISVMDMLKSYFKLDKDERRTLNSVIGELGSSLTDTLLENTKDKKKTEDMH